MKRKRASSYRTRYKFAQKISLRRFYCGPDRTRTDYLFYAIEALYQVSYGPNRLYFILSVILTQPETRRIISASTFPKGVLMNDTYYVYLAGPILGISYGNATEWREYVKRLFPPNIVCLSPMRNKQYLIRESIIDKKEYLDPLSTPKGINTRDRNDVIRCDVMLVNFLGAKIPSLGTAIEFGWADMLRKPIVVAMTENDVHYHKMIRDLAGYIFPTLEESVDMVQKILLP